ncbi:hypothetical protein [Gordonia westfalica]|uniref:Uncharacterized protein n=1 Tax=Gordonia westfalica TaxID=158898 RepID=A0A1H2DM62_9ACTN|nr:hypothetical protein [Gordonia westfalica]SDT83722.1 hypothetical protein SAMN04488548_10142 [Gordonia westfalica]SDT83860.1 hypothetical protein SAMN04488548_1057 [Gordonia westfalica]SDT83937.1 hypothetical protein SAMN04488548_10532 [Gordonia westfalica]SDT83965.1 hypothetical protein SAMN04488548_10542 [Gordonia westfalica]SDT85266.1 hypothetical protein SAMN04488548_11820 [Gordonia westfalica]
MSSGAVEARYAGWCPKCRTDYPVGTLIGYVREYLVFPDGRAGKNVTVCEPCAVEVTRERR